MRVSKMSSTGCHLSFCLFVVIQWLVCKAQGEHSYPPLPPGCQEKGTNASVSGATLRAKSGPAVASSRWLVFRRCHSWGRQMNSDTSMGDLNCWTLLVRPNADCSPGRQGEEPSTCLL